MEIPLLKDLIIIFLLSVAVNFIFSKVKVPTIVGFLFTGVLAGPYGLGLISAVHEVEILAEIGVILLLFTIGVEFSLKNLLQVKKYVLLGGSIQVVLTITASYFICSVLGLNTAESVFVGFLAALSSTAIVLKVLQERVEINSDYGRTALAILIFQDVAIVPLILLTPILAGEGGNIVPAMLILLVKGAGIIGVTYAGSRWLAPLLLHQIARTRSRELFLLTIILLCLAVALLTSSLGLSLALGAFLAGLIVSESDYAHHAFGNILPFKDAFTSFFFVSIGMLLDLRFVAENPLLVFMVASGALLVKIIIVGFSAFILGLPFRTTVKTALALCQIGEFSFILSKFGVDYRLLDVNAHQLFLASAVMTMAAAPFFISAAPGFADFLVKILPLPKMMKRGFAPLPQPDELELNDHLIIVGFGLNGRNLSRAAETANIPYIVMDTNPQTVRVESGKGIPIFFGDATYEAALLHAGIERARVLVTAIPDPASAERIVELARRLAPQLYIIVRTRQLGEIEQLRKLGADEVIPEEFETSVEIFTRVLNRYLVPRDSIDELISEIRADGYSMLRSLSTDAAESIKVQIPDIEITAVRICPGSPAEGKSPLELELPRRYGISIMTVRRKGELLQGPYRDLVLEADDILYVMGPPRRVVEFAGMCRKKSGGENT